MVYALVGRSEISVDSNEKLFLKETFKDYVLTHLDLGTWCITTDVRWSTAFNSFDIPHSIASFYCELHSFLDTPDTVSSKSWHWALNVRNQCFVDCTTSEFYFWTNNNNNNNIYL